MSLPQIVEEECPCPCHMGHSVEHYDSLGQYLKSCCRCLPPAPLPKGPDIISPLIDFEPLVTFHKEEGGRLFLPTGERCSPSQEASVLWRVMKDLQDVGYTYMAQDAIIWRRV